jgi:hypothetical protein
MPAPGANSSFASIFASSRTPRAPADPRQRGLLLLLDANAIVRGSSSSDICASTFSASGPSMPPSLTSADAG